VKCVLIRDNFALPKLLAEDIPQMSDPNVDQVDEKTGKITESDETELAGAPTLGCKK
jgi:hypothetical protein